MKRAVWAGLLITVMATSAIAQDEQARFRDARALEAADASRAIAKMHTLVRTSF